MKSTSVWEAAKTPKFPRLKGSAETDVVVIGAGITGLTTAYLLAKAGRQVVLLEQAKVASGASAYTTAFLTALIDTDFSDLVSVYGRKRAKQIISSHIEATNQIEALARAEEIDCGFRRITHHEYICSSDEDVEDLQERAALARELGFTAEFVDGGVGAISARAHLEYPAQATFHPTRYLAGLVRACVENGVTIYEQSEVHTIEPFEDDDGVIVHTDGGDVTAKWAVVATYNHLLNGTPLFFKKATYTTFVLAGTLQPGTLPEGLYEDQSLPYHYVRVVHEDGEERFLVGGEDRRADIPVPERKHFKALEQYLRDTLGDAATITHKWSGPILEPVDGIAFIGALKHPQILYATGFSGNGLTYGTMTAHIFAGTILGEKNVWTSEYAPIYDANRTPSVHALAVKGRDYLEELYGGAIKDAFK